VAQLAEADVVAAYTLSISGIVRVALRLLIRQARFDVSTNRNNGNYVMMNYY
jgi:hypothetical protein